MDRSDDSRAAPMALRGAADLIAVLPYHLGFTPEASLVVVCLHETSGPRGRSGRAQVRLGMIQRLDLPPPEQAADAAHCLLRPLLDQRATAVFLLVYEQREGDGDRVLEETERACTGHGIEVLTRLVVRGGRWYRAGPGGRREPREGFAVPEPAEVPAVAGFVLQGAAPAPSRDELARRLGPCGPLTAQAVGMAIGDRLLASVVGRVADEGEPERAGPRATGHEVAIWARVLGEGPESLTASDLATVVVSLLDHPFRDALIAWLCPGQLDPGLLDPDLVCLLRRDLPHGADAAVIDRLVRLCARIPDEWSPSVLTVLAAVTWWRGDGALTRIALEKALCANPRYRLAQLLMRMVDLMIRPEAAAG